MDAAEGQMPTDDERTTEQARDLADMPKGNGRAAGARGSHADRTRRSTNALLEAAGELIVEGGFDAMTFAAIGERAGYSRGMVTARFGSKDGLVDALIDRIVGQWSHRNLRPYTKGKPGLDGTLMVIDAIRHQAETNRRSMLVLYALVFEALGPDTGLKARMAEFHREARSDLMALIRRGVKDGSIRKDANIEEEAALIVAGLRGIVYQWILDSDNFDPLPSLAYLLKTTDDRLRASSD